jgi:hypothetical protein
MFFISTKASLSLLVVLILWPTPKAAATSPVFADCRDEATLLPQFLVNRDHHERVIPRRQRALRLVEKIVWGAVT